MTEDAPKLVFESYEFDERTAYEAVARGYLGNVQVELPNGSRYPVLFYDPVRLQQDLETEVDELGNPFISDPGMIVVTSVTLENMQKAVSKLYQERYFSYFQPLG